MDDCTWAFLDGFIARIYSLTMQQLEQETISVSNSPADCSAQLLDVVPLITRRITREMRSRTMPGLSIPQFRTLDYLRRHPGVSLSGLAEFLGLTLPSTSKLIQRLVTQKVISRRVAKDRRRVSLSLTELGKTSLAVARIETHQQLTERLNKLSSEELTTISAAMRILGQAFVKGGQNVNVS